MTKARLILLLVFAALLALYAVGFAHGMHPFGMSDGPYID
jgi:hypothetical protein